MPSFLEVNKNRNNNKQAALERLGQANGFFMTAQRYARLLYPTIVEGTNAADFVTSQTSIARVHEQTGRVQSITLSIFKPHGHVKGIVAAHKMNGLTIVKLPIREIVTQGRHEFLKEGAALCFKRGFVDIFTHIDHIVAVTTGFSSMTASS